METEYKVSDQEWDDFWIGVEVTPTARRAIERKLAQMKQDQPKGTEATQPHRIEDPVVIILRERILRLSRLCRLRRPVTEQALARATRSQLESWSKDLTRTRDHQLREEQNGWSAEQRLSKFMILKARRARQSVTS